MTGPPSRQTARGAPKSASHAVRSPIVVTSAPHGAAGALSVVVTGEACGRSLMVDTLSLNVRCF